jgi:hypothetical protein
MPIGYPAKFLEPQTAQQCLCVPHCRTRFKATESRLAVVQFPIWWHREFAHNPLVRNQKHAQSAGLQAENQADSRLNSLINGNFKVETGFAGLHPPPPKSKTWPDRNENEAVIFDQPDVGKTESVGALTSQSSKNIHLLRDRQRTVTAGAIAPGIK